MCDQTENIWTICLKKFQDYVRILTFDVSRLTSLTELPNGPYLKRAR